MADKVQQILQVAELFRRGNVAAGITQLGNVGTAGVANDTHGVTTVPATIPQLLSGQNLGVVDTLGAGSGFSTLPTTAVAPTVSAVAAAGQVSTANLGSIGVGSEVVAGAPVQGAPAALAAPAAPAVSAVTAAAPTAAQTSALQGIDPERLRLAQAVGSLRLRIIQEAAQQQYVAAYTQQLLEARKQAEEIHRQQQEAAQLALIMEAANAQAEVAKQSLEEEQAEHHWHRRVGRKNETCGHWKRGHCARGDKCQFAHPDKEKGLLEPRGPTEIMRRNFKTSLCKNFTAGNCLQGPRCMFAHGPAELRSPGMPLSKEEEETVQRVAAAKMARLAGTSPAAGTVTPAPVTVLPPGATGAAMQLPGLMNLPGLLGTVPAPLSVPSATAVAEQQLHTDSTQLMAAAGLAALGVDPATIDMSGLAATALHEPPEKRLKLA